MNTVDITSTTASYSASMVSRVAGSRSLVWFMMELRKTFLLATSSAW